jgi:hypothetical protein
MWQSSIDQSIDFGFSQFYAVIIYWLINCRWLQPTERKAEFLMGFSPMFSGNWEDYFMIRFR